MRKIRDLFLLTLLFFLGKNSLHANCNSPYQNLPTYEYDFGGNCAYVGLEAGYQDFYLLPSFFFGETEALEPIGCFTLTDPHAQSPYVAAELGWRISSPCLPCWLNCVGIELSGHYFQDNQKNSCTIERTSGADLVLLFPVINSDTNLILVIPRLLSGSFHRDYKYYGGDIELFTEYCTPPFGCFDCFLVKPYLSFGIQEFNQDYSISFEAVRVVGSVVTFSSLKLSEQLHTTYYDFGPGLQLQTCLFSCLSCFLKGGIFASFNHARFYGEQTFVSTARNEFNLDLTKDTWNSKIKASLGIEYTQFNWTISLIGNYEYWGSLPKIQNGGATLLPGDILSGTAATSIAGSFSAFYSIGGRIGYSF